MGVSVFETIWRQNSPTSVAPDRYAIVSPRYAPTSSADMAFRLSSLATGRRHRVFDPWLNF
jgi:hypothetical protein